MYLEVLKALVLLGIAVKGVGVRFWAAAVTAVAMLYVTVGLIAVDLFHKRFPPITGVVQRHGPALVVAMLIAPVALFAWARVRARTRPAWKEVGELCMLAAIVEAVQLVIVLVWA